MNRVFIASLIVLAIGCGGKSGGNYQLDAKTFNAAKLTMVEKETGISFPTGSHGLNMFYNGYAIDSSFAAKVEIPQASSEKLIGQLSTITNKEISVVNPISKQLSWWKVSEETTKLKRQFIHGNNLVVLNVCQEGEQWIVYLESYLMQ